MIYLDNAATTYPKPSVVYDAIEKGNKDFSFNAGRGSYKKSKECCAIIQDFKTQIANFAQNNSENVTLVSSATEALSIIINGIDFQEGDNVYISPFEHNAIVRNLYNIQKTININIQILPFDKNTWEPDIDKINDIFVLNKPKAIFISQISNATGLMIDYKNLFKKGKEYGAICILDSAQSFGILTVDTKDVDFIVFAGHKSMYGVFGVGGFININNTKLNLIKAGGNGSNSLNHNMPESGGIRYEAGSPNIPAIYATKIAFEWVLANDIFSKEKELTDYLISELKKISKIKVYLPKDFSNIFGIVSFSIDGYTSDEIGEILDNEFDIAIRTGYHCAPFVHDFIGSTFSHGTGRISIGCFNTKQDVDNLIKALGTL